MLVVVLSPGGMRHAHARQQYRRQRHSLPALPRCAGRHRLAVPDLGFQRKLVVPGEDGQVLHAELTYASPNGANGMLMLGSSVRDNAYGRLMRHVDEAGGNTQSLYLVVADPDALFRSAQAAGAEIVIDIKDEDYGGRGFTCRDPEGHVWSFGSYDPWA